jgi:hypothetical protein
VGEPYRLLIVRRDRPEVLRAILNSRRQWPPGTAVMLDRRRADRRVRALRMLTDRRVRQRRADMDPNWHTHGFIVRDVARVPAEAAVLQPRDSSPDFGLRQPPAILGGQTRRRAPTRSR